MNMQQCQCKDCLQVFKVEYDGADIGGTIPHYCAYCGSPKITRVKFDAYWYDLAESLGFPRNNKSAKLVSELYKMWEPKEHSKFRDFVNSVKELV